MADNERDRAAESACKERKIKTAVLISGGGTNLQALIDACSGGVIRHAELCAVISNKEDAYGLVRAKNAGIPAYTVMKKNAAGLSDEERRAAQREFEEGIIKIIEDTGAELIVLAGFLAILSADFTRRFPDRIINIHPSLIPSFCGKGYYGLKVHEAALSYGVKVTGATVHFVNEIPDGGKIILQRAVYIKEGDTPETLQKRVMEEAEWKILPEALELVSEKLLRA